MRYMLKNDQLLRRYIAIMSRLVIHVVDNVLPEG